MTVLTDIAELHTAASRSAAPHSAMPRPASTPVRGARAPGACRPGVPGPVRQTMPGHGSERRLDRDVLARAPHRPAASACVVRPAARPVRFLVVLGLATAITVVLLAMLGAVSGGATSVPETTTVTQVRAGETLWDVAQRTAPGADTAAVLDRIQELNQLSSGAVRAGQPITVPAAS